MSQDPLSPLPSRKTTKKAKRSGNKRIWIRAALIALLVIVLGVGVLVGYYYLKMNQTIDKVTSTTDIDVPDEQLAKEKPLTVLLLGMDTRGNLRLMNTDIIMVISMNPNDKKATLVSIPRDTYMKPSGYYARKANAFYSVAYHEDKDSAMEKVQGWFSDMVGVPIDYTVVVTFKTLEDIVDALGGIHVNVDQDMEYVDNADGTHINLKAGEQTLDGKNTLDFVRYRQSNRNTGASSDLERNQRQQQVISKIVDKIKSPTIIFKAGGILDAIGDNVTSNIPEKQLESMIRTYVGISNSDIQFIHLAGTWKSPFMYLEEEGFDAAKQALKDRITVDTKVE